MTVFTRRSRVSLRSMLRLPLALVLFLALTGLTVPLGAASVAAPVAAPVAAHSISVAGAGVGMYPAFEPAVERYGVTTTGATGGAVEVTATTSDPDGVVLVNGRAVTGPTLVTGLGDGDEISVIIEDSDGRSVHSLVHLPARFPTLEVVENRPETAPGVVGLTLSEWNANSDHFETAVDRNGVPAYVQRVPGNSMDFKRQADGVLSVSRATSTPGRTGHGLHLLDDQLRSTSVHETEGLKNTDGHDSIVLPNGHIVLLSYEFDEATQLTDSVIQELDAAGNLLFEWNSADHLDIEAESTSGTSTSGPWRGDYAHINSVQVLPDGNFLASFRHTSSVMKIARSGGDGHQAGDVLWRLGGKLSDFKFVNDPHAGPCAQHTAYMAENGNIVIFDNGSWAVNGTELCVDPDDPTGPSVDRPFTRITEYAIDEDAGTAELVWSYERTMPDALGNPTRLFAIFAGSGIRLPNGSTLVNWASEKRAMASELTAAGDVAWEVRDANPTIQARFFSYRAFKFDLPDAIDPEVTLSLPGEGVYAQGASVPVDWSCTDRGGSSLQACDIDGPDGLLDTSTTGEHTVTVIATDGAGNVTMRSRDYTVAKTHQPDGFVRVAGSGWVGKDVYGGWRDQRVVTKNFPRDRTQVAKVRLQNDGVDTERFRVRSHASNADFKVRYVHGGRNVTKKVTAGTWRTPAMEFGEKTTLKVWITRTKRADRGDKRRFVVRTSSAANGTTDRVAVIAKAKR